MSRRAEKNINAEICPVGVVSMVDGVAEVDLKKCIRCYCCDEHCEHDAIDLKRPFLMRLAGPGR